MTPNSIGRLVALGAFALGMASYVTAGLLPLIQQDLQLSVALAAHLVTAFALADGLLSPVVVAMLPGHWLRRGLLTALSLFVVANIASALSQQLWTLLAWRALTGVCAGVYMALGITAANASAAPDQRSRTTARIMAGMASGTVLGVPLGLVLANHAGWPAAFWLIATLAAVALIGLWRVLPALTTTSVPITRKLAMLKDRRVMPVILVSLMAAIASLGMYTFLAPFLQAVDGDGVLPLPLVLWVWGLGGIAGSTLIGPVAERMDDARLTGYLATLLTLALAALPMIGHLQPWLLLLPVALWGAVGWAFQVPQNGALLTARQDHGDGSLAVALNGSALYLGSALGASAGGVVFLLQWPVWTLAVLAAALAGLATLVQWQLWRRAPVTAPYAPDTAAVD